MTITKNTQDAFRRGLTAAMQDGSDGGFQVTPGERSGIRDAVLQEISQAPTMREAQEAFYAVAPQLKAADVLTGSSIHGTHFMDGVQEAVVATVDAIGRKKLDAEWQRLGVPAPSEPAYQDGWEVFEAWGAREAADKNRDVALDTRILSGNLLRQPKGALPFVKHNSDTPPVSGTNPLPHHSLGRGTGVAAHRETGELLVWVKEPVLSRKMFVGKLRQYAPNLWAGYTHNHGRVLLNLDHHKPELMLDIGPANQRRVSRHEIKPESLKNIRGIASTIPAVHTPNFTPIQAGARRADPFSGLQPELRNDLAQFGGPVQAGVADLVGSGPRSETRLGHKNELVLTPRFQLPTRYLETTNRPFDPRDVGAGTRLDGPGQGTVYLRSGANPEICYASVPVQTHVNQKNGDIVVIVPGSGAGEAERPSFGVNMAFNPDTKRWEGRVESEDLRLVGAATLQASKTRGAPPYLQMAFETDKNHFAGRKLSVLTFSHHGLDPVMHEAESVITAASAAQPR